MCGHPLSLVEYDSSSSAEYDSSSSDEYDSSSSSSGEDEESIKIDSINPCYPQFSTPLETFYEFSSSDSEDENLQASPEERRKKAWRKKAKKRFLNLLASDGFDLDSDEEPCSELRKYHEVDDPHPITLESAKFAIEEHNRIENDGLEFVRILKLNVGVGSGIVYYFTLEAKDPSNNNLAAIYQARVWCTIPHLKRYLELFRLSPSHDTSN